MPGIRALNPLKIGQVTLTEENADLFIQACNRAYPGGFNGSFRGALGIVVNDFLNIAAILSPEDIKKIKEITNKDSILEALAFLGEERIKQNGHATTKKPGKTIP